MSTQQPTGISPDQLFQQFTKSNSVVSNSFQLLFEGVKELEKLLGQKNQENTMLKKLLADNKIEIPKPATVEDPAPKSPNRKERRAEAKKKKSK